MYKCIMGSGRAGDNAKTLNSASERARRARHGFPTSLSLSLFLTAISIYLCNRPVQRYAGIKLTRTRAFNVYNLIG